jgi:hypothetical protein
MNWMAKTRPNATATAAARTNPGPSTSQGSNPNVRVSNALKEFLWLISDVPHGRILDLGPVWQSTVAFFIDKGYRISTEDLLRTWKDFQTDEEDQQRSTTSNEDQKVTQTALAEKFLEKALQYPAEHFHGVLAWDLLDYFDPQVVPFLLERLFTSLYPGGVVLTLFHSRSVERYNRYRILDSQTIEMVPSPTIAVHAHVFQNREIMDLFGKFRSSKTFVGRDQVRESLFLK